MTEYPELQHFLERIMNINVLRMGGASAGILGSAGADNDIIENLKRSSIAFAGEYRKPTPSPAELERLSGDIGGFLQTLQLINALSEKETQKLLDELDVLLEKNSA